MSHARSFSHMLGRLSSLVVVAAVFLLASCGGGGGTDNQAIAPNQFALAATPVPIEATVVAITKLSETRISRTVFDYTFSITVKNGPKAVTALTATLTGVGTGTSILDGVVDIGALAAGATTAPAKTIKVRHDRTFTFNQAAFQWSFVGTLDTPMIVGRAMDGYLRGAIVFWDCNNNFRLDAGEIGVVTGQGGIYSIPFPPAPACKLSANVPTSTIDEDSNLRVQRPMFLRALDANPTVI